MPELNEDKKGKLITILAASKLLGIKKNVIKYQIEVGNITSVNGKIYESDCNEISLQQSVYIGIKTFLKQHDNERFVSKYVYNRDKYIDFLEENDYFGINTIDPDNIFFDIPEREEFYITKEDAQYLEFKSGLFFREFGLTEAEKIGKIISESENHPLSTKYVAKYLEYLGIGNDKYTPAITAFVRSVFDMPDINLLEDEEIISAVKRSKIVRTKKLIVEYCKYVANYEHVRYHIMDLKKKESESEPAYPYEDYVRLAKILFNKEYDKEHNLTLKALENSRYAELWLFLACHYICGWRAEDICNRWVYPALSSNNNLFGIDVDNLKEDIINEHIPDAIYEKVALYAIKRIDMANNMPGKTGFGKLRAEIVPDLRRFFGKLMLIAECHHRVSGRGYMDSRRMASYRNWVICNDFFGEEILSITGRRSLSSRRLNKSYLQGIEQAARDNGSTTLVAHVVAAFARNHANIDTTAIYLKDHGLTGESAEVVLYMMMQRGVFSVSLYHALLAAYPGVFDKLSSKEQTAIMEKIPLSAFELETAGTLLLDADRITAEFAEGKTEEPKKILKAMYSIAQGRGKAKDAGIYCKKKALGYSCEHPTFDSCLANLCPHHVFTSDGVPALIKVINDYQIKSIGNKKYEIALKTKIIPAFQEIINAIIKDMSEKEKKGIKILLKEALRG